MRMQPPISMVLLALFAVCRVAASASTSAASEPTDAYNVPTFDLTDLRAGRRRDDLASALGTTGLLSVTLGGQAGTPAATSLGRDRDVALDGLCRCAAAGPAADPFSSSLRSVPGSDSALLSDGETLRTTVATATVGDAPLPLPRDELLSACGTHEEEATVVDVVVDAMDALRDAVADVSSAFVGAVDGLLRDASHVVSADMTSPQSPLLRTDAGASYSTVGSIQRASRHLEHFHVYSKESKNEGYKVAQEDGDNDVISLHTDAGLFLSFIPGILCPSAKASSESRQVDESFFILDPTDGRTKKVIFPSQPSVAIMLGVGAERWLDVPTLSESPLVTLRATRHSVKMRNGDRRAWYGMMHLVPDSAIVQAEPRRTFADMRQSVAHTSKASVTSRRYGDDGNGIDVAVGCGISPPEEFQTTSASEHAPTKPRQPRRRLQHVVDGSACNNSTNFYCWMSCLEIPDAENAIGHLREGQSLYCLDPAVLAGSGNRVSAAVEPCEEPGTGVPGGAMNSACVGAWQATAPGVPAQKVNVDYDEGGQEAQYCYGATSMYMQGFEWQGTQCVVYLFQSWVLNTPGKFAAAALGTLLFGIALEGAIHMRRSVLAKSQAAAAAGGPGSSKALWGHYIALSAGTYALQLTMGYLIMLVIMSYSAPLFICVVLGLVGGHVLFAAFARRQKAQEQGANTIPAGNSIRDVIPEGCTPCCQNNLSSLAVQDPRPMPARAEVEAASAPCCGRKKEGPFRDEDTEQSRETCCIGTSDGSGVV